MQTNPRIRVVLLALLVQFFLTIKLPASLPFNFSTVDLANTSSETIKTRPIRTERFEYKLDSGTRLLLRQTAKLNKQIMAVKPLILNQTYSVWPDESGILMVDVFILVNSPADTIVLKRQEVQIRAFVDNWVVARLPLEAVPDLTKAEFVHYVEISKINQPQLNVSRPGIKVDNVHQGIGLPTAYQGEDVIIGIVDSGIDFTHPDFHSNNGSRILYLLEYEENGRQTVWTKSQIDSNPSGVTQRDGNGAFGHGTHTAGTATGAGRANTDYAGIAPKADIIFVKGIREPESNGSFSDADVMSGCQFIFDKARQLGKPAVINLSLGGHFGPHDGTSAYETTLSGLTGSGRIIVAAAGNEGDEAIHAGGNTASGKPNLTILGATNTAIVAADIWADYQTLSEIYIQAWGLNAENKLVPLIQTDWLPVGQNLTDQVMRVNGTTLGYVSIETVSKDPLNGDERITVVVSNNNEPDVNISNYLWFIITRGNHTGRMDMWAVMGVFVSQVIGFTDVYEMPGNSDQTIGQPATAKNLIGVGAYITKTEWTDKNNQFQTWPGVIGDRSAFSSMGPTRDGRIKPDIIAPGERIAAPLSSHLTAGVGYEESDIIQGGKYQLMNGTSMAAPHVTGLVALMLEANPTLNYSQTLQILQETAIKDQFTGSGLNNQCGTGKIDAYAAMQRVAGSGSAAKAVIDATLLTIYVKPDKTSSVPFTIRNTGNATLNFNMTTTDPDLTLNMGNYLGVLQAHPQPKSGPARMITSASPARPIPQVSNAPKIPVSQSNLTIAATDSLLLDDGNYEPDYFIGWDSKKLGMTWLNEFKSTDYDFELQSLTFYMRTEASESNRNRVAVYDKSFNRIADGTIEYPLAPRGAWFGAVLSNPILIKKDQRFFIEIETQAGIEYPGGADQDAKISGKSYYMDQDGELIKLSDHPQFATTAWLIRAFGRKIGANQPPRAVASVSKTSVNIGETVVFNASQSSDPDGQITDYLWTFGDGTTSTQMVASHAYSAAGVKNYSLKVTDNLGATDTVTGSLTVGSSNLAPVAKAKVTPSTARVGETITFEGSESYDPDGKIQAYIWNFGDGTGATIANTTHAYDSPGQKQYSLMVFDNLGAASTVTGQVTITPAANRLTVSPETGSIPAGDSHGITASFSAWNMAEGNYVGMIHLSSNGGNVELPVQIVVSNEDAIDTEVNLPLRYHLGQNYPNPFNPETTIDYELPEAADVGLQIFDITGRRIQSLVQGFKSRGHHQVKWNGQDFAGQSVASGIYFYRLTVKPAQGGETQIFNQRMLLLK